jgi:hemoglobin
MQDITCREDIEKLIAIFYEKALKDAIIGYLFTDIAQINLKEHLPMLVDFWENTLLQPNGYKKNVLQTHLDLHHQSKLETEHFEQWLFLFEETVLELFEGKVAQKAINRANSIATVIQTKLYKQQLYGL